MKKYTPRIHGIEPKHHLDAQPTRDNSAVILPISAIKVRGDNIRSELKDIDELADSIRAVGLLNPVTVRKGVGGLELIAGHRRLAAARKAGLKEISARVVEAADNHVAVLRLIENIQRDDLTGWETCKAVSALLPIFETQAKVAEAIKKDKGYVSKCVAVMNGELEVERVQHLPLRDLFMLIGKSQKSQVGERKPSGPIPGGHAIDRVIRYNERRGGKGFTLKVHFDFEKSSEGDRDRLLTRLRELIKRLESKNEK